MHVAVAAASALQHDLTKIAPGQIRDHLAGHRLAHHRPLGNAEHQILAVLAVAALLAALLAVRGGELAPVTVVEKRVEAFVHLEDHIAAASAVTAVRAAVGYIFFSPETHMAIAAFSGADNDFCSVCEHF